MVLMWKRAHPLIMSTHFGYKEGNYGVNNFQVVFKLNVHTMCMNI